MLSSISRLLFCQGSLINLKALIYTSFFSLRTSFQLQDQEFGIKLLSKIGRKSGSRVGYIQNQVFASKINFSAVSVLILGIGKIFIHFEAQYSLRCKNQGKSVVVLCAYRKKAKQSHKCKFKLTEKRQKNALSNTSFSVYHLGQYFFIYCF